jgi:hypothetical protein
MSQQRSAPEPGAPNRRNIILTVIALIVLIIAAIAIGILSIRLGGPVQPPPENAGIGALIAGLSMLVNTRAVL